MFPLCLHVLGGDSLTLTGSEAEQVLPEAPCGLSSRAVWVRGDSVLPAQFFWGIQAQDTPSQAESRTSYGILTS